MIQYEVWYDLPKQENIMEVVEVESLYELKSFIKDLKRQGAYNIDTINLGFVTLYEC